jgi:dihydroorotate dehydrogenase
MYKLLLRPLLFCFDPEKVHYFTFSLIRTVSKIPGFSLLFRTLYLLEDPFLERELFGLKFKNPVGLAAGFDKNAVLYNELFRLKDDKGIINRMGFNNEGLDAAILKLKKNKGKLLIGGNIGKNSDTKPEDYTKDYIYCFNGLHPYVDYFVLNVSCPNVDSDAKLNDKDYLLELIHEVQKANNVFDTQKPIVLKIAPDLNDIQLDEIIELIAETKLDGVIASNTSIDRAGLKASNERLTEIGNGGLSGQPIKEKSTRVIKYLSEKSNKSFTIIGVGGIHSAEDALEKIEAGADLIQIYTGFIYEGPRLIKNINKALLKKRTNS